MHRGDICGRDFARGTQDGPGKDRARGIGIRQRLEPLGVAPREDVEDDRGPALIVLLPARGGDDEAPLQPHGRRAHPLPLVPGEARQLSAAHGAGLEQRLGDVPLDGRELLVAEVVRLPAPAGERVEDGQQLERDE